MKNINLRSAFAVAGVAGLAAVSILGAHADVATAQINGNSNGGSGTLTLTTQPTVAFAAVQLGGVDTSTNANDVMQTVDSTGTGAGFQVSMSASQFGAAGGHTLPANGLNATSLQHAANTGTDSDISNLVSYPLNIPSTPVKLFNADVNSGLGTVNETAAFNLAVPANTYQGSYQSTWTLTIATAP